ncbi:MAG TPA: TlyA family RNA methyltransferase [Actinomycetota bacterium]|nr:TlyA family RNA methyltransferase [Actinomycetota bacterium]
MTRRRLDRELVRRGLAASPAEARRAIDAGRVVVGGRASAKAGTLVDPSESVTVRDPSPRYASRGGAKLDHALDRMSVEVRGRRCLDAGASSGGFTDVLLSRGAAAVVAVDVGYGQLAWRLRGDPRVTVMERTNVRTLQPGDLPYRPELIAADLSFVSLTAAVPAFRRVTAPGADLVLLVKPQFEAGRDDVEEGGVVRDPDAWRSAIERVAEACREARFGPMAVAVSPIRGPAGNVEFFLHARDGVTSGDLDLEATIRSTGEVGVR